MDRDWQVRLAAFAQLESIRRRRRGDELVTRAEMNEGFAFDGRQIALADRWKGIWKPQQLGRGGAALSILTSAPRPGRPAPYDDDLDESTGFFTYKYEGTDPDLPTNRAVRRAMELRRPLIYFIGAEPGVFQAHFPAYVTADSPNSLSFRIELGISGSARDPVRVNFEADAVAREYATRSVKVRLHQRRFRQLVLGAYRTRCAVCALRHPDLLDAAHILEDRLERGLPEIPNGLALCKIHHSAYDADILGISPDYRVHVNLNLLEIRDGPMLEHGLKGMANRDLVVPVAREKRPNREFLGLRFDRFRAA